VSNFWGALQKNPHTAFLLLFFFRDGGEREHAVPDDDLPAEVDRGAARRVAEREAAIDRHAELRRELLQNGFDLLRLAAPEELAVDHPGRAVEELAVDQRLELRADQFRLGVHTFDEDDPPFGVRAVIRPGKTR